MAKGQNKSGGNARKIGRRLRKKKRILGVKRIRTKAPKLGGVRAHGVWMDNPYKHKSQGLAHSHYEG